MTHPLTEPAEHGGAVDVAARRFGCARAGWLDLSTGINPMPYPVPAFATGAWAALPDTTAALALGVAARTFRQVLDATGFLAAPGASASPATLPRALPAGQVRIPGPTCNEHSRAFASAGCSRGDGGALVVVNPNNPEGRVWAKADAPLCIIDESDCDVMPDASLITLAIRPGTVMLKSFGKFWRLAGLRLGFAIGDPAMLATLAQMSGPWPVSGPALAPGAQALRNTAWIHATRIRLAADAARLNAMVRAPLIGGTTLFRLYNTDDAQHRQSALARHHIRNRVFPCSARWLRLGLPGPDGRDGLHTTALATL